MVSCWVCISLPEDLLAFYDGWRFDLARHISTIHITYLIFVTVYLCNSIFIITLFSFRDIVECNLYE